jgi:hypothetical protein
MNRFTRLILNSPLSRRIDYLAFCGFTFILLDDQVQALHDGRIGEPGPAWRTLARTVFIALVGSS